VRSCVAGAIPSLAALLNTGDGEHNPEGVTREWVSC